MQAESRIVDPTLYRRRLRNDLRRAREAAGKSQREVTQAMDWSPSKLLRIEAGAVNVSTNDLRVMLGFYGVDAESSERLIDLAKKARETTTWTSYKNVVSPTFLSFCGYEASASIIRNYESRYVPGLLQTEEYARAVFTAHDVVGEKLESLVDLRIQRQEILSRDQPPSFHFIIDEAVFLRPIGSYDILRRQLSKMQEALSNPAVTMRIVRFDRGYNPYLGTGFTLLEFDEPDDGSILYLEPSYGEMLVREASEMQELPSPTQPDVDPATMLEFFWALEQQADKRDSPALMRQFGRRLSPGTEQQSQASPEES